MADNWDDSDDDWDKSDDEDDLDKRLGLAKIDDAPPAFDDDEEDLLAYISMMCSKSDTRNHLINVFRGNYSGPS